MRVVEDEVRDYVAMAGEPDVDELVVRCIEWLEDIGLIVIADDVVIRRMGTA